MTCDPFFTISSFADFLVFPIGCHYFFYLEFFLVILGILTWGLYHVEKSASALDADFLSSLGVSSIVVTVLAVFGTFIQNADGMSMVQTDVLLYLLAITVPIIGIWIFRD